MRTAVIFGASGFAGLHISRELSARNWLIKAVSRSGRGASSPGIERLAGSIFDDKVLKAACRGVDAVVVAIRAQRTLEGSLADRIPQLLQEAATNGARLGVVGGAGSLLIGDTEERLVDQATFPAAARPEALAHVEVLSALRKYGSGVDWFYLSPPAVFGAHAQSPSTGTYRTGKDHVLRDAEGTSAISGDDYAVAFADELELPRHHATRFTVAAA